jgi:tungstate transport system substrate-binding protein
MKLVKLTRAVATLGIAWIALTAAAQNKTIQMASTTSTEQSGLFAHLLPKFQTATGITIKVTAVGTGQAIDIAKRGDADVLFVHNQSAEEKFVAEGYSVKRYPVMYNDFVLIARKLIPQVWQGTT